MRSRSCVTGKDPDAFATVPDFETPHYRGDSIREIAEALISHFDELSWIPEGEYRIVYFWKRKGGVKAGKPVLGSARKAAGLVAHLTDATFVIELGADHCRGMANYELEAAIYHQLAHLGEEEIESSDPDVAERVVPVIRAHSVEMFTAELDRYGLWSIDIRRAGDAFAKQLSLDLRPAQESGSVVEAEWTESDEQKRRQRVAEQEAEEAAAVEREMATGVPR